MANSIHIDEQQQKKDSLALSILLHSFLLILLLIPIVKAFSKEPPKPEFHGIQVALGYKAAETKTKTKPAPSTSSEKKTIVKPKATSKPKAQSKTKVAKTAKATPSKVVSKTLEKVAEVVATKEKVVANKVEVKSPKKSASELAKEKAEEDARIKAAEAKAKAKAEAKRKADAETKKAAAKAAAKSKFSNLMNNAKGDGEPSKGNPNGHPDASALEGISKGKGKAGSGLGDRELVYAPVISDKSQQTGRVIVNICVDNKGRVISAKYTQKGSTTNDSHLIKLATENAKKYKFSSSSSEEQCGELTIDFKLK